MQSTNDSSNLVAVFNALADRTRLRLLNLMSDGEMCVCFFVEILNTNQPKISRHLAYLRRVGIVEARRDGKWIHYRLVEPADSSTASILKEVLQRLSEDPQMQQDRQQMECVCCAPELPEQLQGAPLPVRFERAAASCVCG